MRIQRFSEGPTGPVKFFREEFFRIREEFRNLEFLEFFKILENPKTLQYLEDPRRPIRGLWGPHNFSQALRPAETFTVVSDHWRSLGHSSGLSRTLADPSGPIKILDLFVSNFPIPMIHSSYSTFSKFIPVIYHSNRKPKPSQTKKFATLSSVHT